MAHYEDADLGVSFDLPDSPNALTVLTYDSRRIETTALPAFLVMWECTKSIVTNWQSDTIPDIDMDLSSINGNNAVRAAKIVKFAGMRGSDWRLDLELVSKNS